MSGERADHDAKRRGICMHCARPAVLARRLDACGWRATQWCFGCAMPAHAGASFVGGVSAADMERLPIAVSGSSSTSPQGRLPL